MHEGSLLNLFQATEQTLYELHSLSFFAPRNTVTHWA